MTSDPETTRHVQSATQAAVDATATAYTDDAAVDVEERLRSELSQRGLEIDDDAWLVEVAHRVRSGHHVVFDGPPES